MKKLLLLVMVAAVGYSSVSSLTRPVEVQEVKVTATYGDTMWNICERYYSNKEVRCFEEFVYDNREDNGLVGQKILQAGQEVVIKIKKQK